MGFRVPLTTPTAVDTGAGQRIPRVRVYATAIGAYRSGVVEWSDAVNSPATATLGSGGVSGGTGFALHGANSQGVTAPTVALNVEGLPAGGYGSAFRVSNADVIDLGPVAALRQVTASGLYPANAWGSVLLQVAEADTYGGWNPNEAGAGAGGFRWTCPAGQAGLYAIEGRLPINSATAGTTVGARILRSGAVVQGGVGDLVPVGAAGSVSLTTGRRLLPLIVGAYVELQGFATQQWQTRVTTADGVAPTLMIERVG